MFSLKVEKFSKEQKSLKKLFFGGVITETLLKTLKKIERHLNPGHPVYEQRNIYMYIVSLLITNTYVVAF